jgi:MFS transporter, DHA1 family, multidrug resistance protein
MAREAGATGRGSRLVLPLALFFATFAWSFTYVSLPFYITRISTLDAAATLRWSGWILGISPLTTVVTGPVWGRFARVASPKTLYIWVELLQGAGFLLMAVARTLLELFLTRLLLGVMGAASTFAFIIAGRTSAHVRRDVSAIQSGMTIGQVIGPLAGALVAARIGFQPSFAVSGLILFGCALLVWRAVPDPPPVPDGDRRASPAAIREVSTTCLLVLAGSMHVFFLTAILPQILPGLAVPLADSLEIGGVIIFASGLAAALGAVAAPRLAELGRERRIVPWCLAGSSVCLGALALAPEVWSFGALRFLQVLCIAPVFPLAVGAIAPGASGEAIGFVNSARIGAAFLGPVVATTLLAWGSPGLVYLTLAAAGLAMIPAMPGAWRPRSR